MVVVESVVEVDAQRGAQQEVKSATIKTTNRRTAWRHTRESA